MRVHGLGLRVTGFRVRVCERECVGVWVRERVDLRLSEPLDGLGWTPLLAPARASIVIKSDP